MGDEEVMGMVCEWPWPVIEVVDHLDGAEREEGAEASCCDAVS